MSIPNSKKSKNKSFYVVLAAGIGLLAMYLVYSGLAGSTTFYYTTAEALAGQSDNSRGIRVMGVVKKNSIHKDIDQRIITFTLHDVDEPAVEMDVTHHGLVVPDIFKDEAHAIVEGNLEPDGKFSSYLIQTKCPSKYEPE